MEERTLVIIKPDGVLRGCAEEIIERYSRAGLEIIRRTTLKLSRSIAENFYGKHRGKFFFEGLTLAMSSGNVVALLLEGRDAINKVRKLNGATDPNKAEPGTIRYDFRSAGGPFNMVHASDSPEAFIYELKIIFPDLK